MFTGFTISNGLCSATNSAILHKTHLEIAPTVSASSLGTSCVPCMLPSRAATSSHCPTPRTPPLAATSHVTRSAVSAWWYRVALGTPPVSTCTGSSAAGSLRHTGHWWRVKRPPPTARSDAPSSHRTYHRIASGTLCPRLACSSPDSPSGCGTSPCCLYPGWRVGSSSPSDVSIVSEAGEPFSSFPARCRWTSVLGDCPSAPLSLWSCARNTGSA